METIPKRVMMTFITSSPTTTHNIACTSSNIIRRQCYYRYYHNTSTTNNDNAILDNNNKNNLHYNNNLVDDPWIKQRPITSGTGTILETTRTPQPSAPATPTCQRPKQNHNQRNNQYKHHYHPSPTILTTPLATPAVLRKNNIGTSGSSLAYFTTSWSATSSADSISSLSTSLSPIDLNVMGTTLKHHNLLVVIKQTAFEEYSQLKLRGQAPKAVRWKRLEQRYKAHKCCVTDLLAILHKNQVNFSCVNRVELDRQHLANIDLMIAVGGDGTVLSAAHFLDHGTIPLLGINSDPNISIDDSIVIKKNTDERRSYGALCMCTALDMDHHITNILHGNSQSHTIRSLNRIQCKVKSTFSETILVPALNDLLIANPSPAAVSRFRMGWLNESNDNDNIQSPTAMTSPSSSSSSLLPANSTTRFSGTGYNVVDSINVWSSGMWISTATGSTAAMYASGGNVMNIKDNRIQYLIREHMIEQHNLKNLEEFVKSRRLNNNIYNDDDNNDEVTDKDINNGYINDGEKVHIRWNSQRGRIFIDGSHLIHNLELGDEILIDNLAPKLQMYTKI